MNRYEYEFGENTCSSDMDNEMACHVIPKVERQTSTDYHNDNIDMMPNNGMEKIYDRGEQKDILNLDTHRRKDKVMSLWTKTQQLPADFLKEIQNIYATQFPIEVRHYFAEWIESQPWSQIDENKPEHEEYAIALLTQLLQLIQQKSDQLPVSGDFFLLKLRFENIIEEFRDKYENSPLGLVRVVKNCLNHEESLIQQADNPSQVPENQNAHNTAKYKQITKDLETLLNLALVTDSDVKQLQDKQEALILQWRNVPQVTAQLTTAIEQTKQQVEFANTQIQQHQTGGADNQAEMDKLVSERDGLKNRLVELTNQKNSVNIDLTAKAQEVVNLRMVLIDKYQRAFQALEDVQKKVVDVELIAWKRKQQLAGNGAPMNGQLLDRLQSWVESLADIIWKNRQQIINFDLIRSRLPLNNVADNQPDLLPELNQKITGLLSSLVTSTFIVEQQPPQVLKKEAKFTAKIRLLVGGKLNISMSPPDVKASIISEEQARGLLKNDTKAKEADSGDILNKEGRMEYHEARGELSIQFKNMQLKKIKRADKKGTEAVTEEKFCILFQSDFQLGNGELMFQVWTLSLPVVVTVHGNQECNALATVLWDNQFAEPVIISSFQNGRTPFVVPSTVPWPSMAQMLNTKFQALTGRGLTSDNLKYLASKVFGGKPTDDYSGHSINWQLFNKDVLPGRNFTFWEWFYSIMRLIKDHLKNLWADGTIIGFISKTQAQEWLQKKPVGTFLCRFSDSELGGVTIAWSAEDPKMPGERQVWNLAPYGTKEINARTLADRIKDLPQLTHLFPDKPKHQAFSKYYSTDAMEESNREGYIRSHLINFVNTPGAAPMNAENPQSPQAFHYTGPDSPVYQASTPGPSSVSSSTTHASMMDQITPIPEMEEDIMDAFSALDYSADDNLMDIIGNLN